MNLVRCVVTGVTMAVNRAIAIAIGKYMNVTWIALSHKLRDPLNEALSFSPVAAFMPFAFYLLSLHHPCNVMFLGHALHEHWPYDGPRCSCSRGTNGTWRHARKF